MKQIYFILTDSGTLISKIVKTLMKDEFGHVSISLDKELTQMYSFARLNPYNAFYGGFIQEYVHEGTFKRFKNTKSKIIALDVTDWQYEKIEEIINNFKENKKQYKFNIIGLFAVYFNKKISRENYYYCAEFVKYISEEARLYLNLPDIVRPDHFKNIKGIDEIYNGLLREYC